MNKRSTLALSLAVVALALALVAGMALPTAASAAGKKPVVKSITPKKWSTAGGAVVTVTGKNFKLGGKKVVKSVRFGAKAGKKLKVRSATKLTVVAPAGKGTVHIRVITTRGTSRAVRADRFTYLGPARAIVVRSGDGQTVSAGTSVPVKPSVVVRDAKKRGIPGVKVTFAVASGGGSVTGAAAVTNAKGVAAVGSWTLGGAAGVNTLTAKVAGLAPRTFTANGDAGLLSVKLRGTAVRSYSLAELQALPPFEGSAGYRSSGGKITGPDEVVGVRVTDVVADALGVPLAVGQAVEVTDAHELPPYTKTFTYDRIVNFAGFVMYDPATETEVPLANLAGRLASVLVYDDPAGRVMPEDKGPLRFFVADAATVDPVVMSPGGDSVAGVNELNVVGPATQMALNAGDGQTASAGTAVPVAPSVRVTDAGDNPVPGVHVTFAVASGGGSVTGAAAVTNAKGIAAVGAWTLGGTAGTNTLTATAAGLAGSPVTFTATGDAGILAVRLHGVPIRSYSLAELQGLTPFAGFAGYRNNQGAITGPAAVTGVKVTDIVGDALGAPLAEDGSVDVVGGGDKPATRNFTHDRLVNFTDFVIYDAATNTVVALDDLTGPLACILIYDDPGGEIMPPTRGPLRFILADAVNENAVMFPANEAVSNVVALDVLTPATQMALYEGDDQTASAGTAVPIAPSVRVTDAGDNPVPGVHVTFAVASGGGSVTGADAVSDASGIAAVGSWTLGGTAGENTLRATVAGLTGSPVTFTATGDAGILTVKDEGVAVRSYSLAELQALPPFAGIAGFRNSLGNITGPEAVTGAKVTDIVADALGTPLAADQSVEVTDAHGTTPYTQTFTYDRLVTFAGFEMYRAPDNVLVAFSDLVGPVASVLVYDNPAGGVMKAKDGPLRFFVADAATADSVVMSPGSDSVKCVNELNVVGP